MINSEDQSVHSLLLVDQLVDSEVQLVDSEVQLEVQLEFQDQMKFNVEIPKSLTSQMLSELEVMDVQTLEPLQEEMLNTQRLSTFTNHQKTNHALMQDQLKLKQRNTTKLSSLRHQVMQEQVLEPNHAHK
jgi:hypothetical protein